MSTAPTNDADPRYAQVEEMTAVCYYDRGWAVEVVCATPELARRYIAGQSSDENYSVEPVQVIRALPETRPLYIIRGALPYKPNEPATREEDSFAAEGEFPGLGNGATVPLGEATSELREWGGGWALAAAAWDRAQAEAAFEARVAEAEAARTARMEAFGPYLPGAVARTPEGENLTRITRAGVRCWLTHTGDVRHDDDDVDAAALTLIAPGPDQGESET